jgi:hypothetical protein
MPRRMAARKYMRSSINRNVAFFLIGGEVYFH